jgi:hypothetical protein
VPKQCRSSGSRLLFNFDADDLAGSRRRFQSLPWLVTLEDGPECWGTAQEFANAKTIRRGCYIRSHDSCVLSPDPVCR